MRTFRNGDVVAVRASSGQLMRKRVWRDEPNSEVVYLTHEDENERAIREQDDAEAPGWLRERIEDWRLS